MQRTKQDLLRFVKAHQTEGYINTITRLSPTNWKFGAEAKALAKLLLKLEEQGMITVHMDLSAWLE